MKCHLVVLAVLAVIFFSNSQAEQFSLVEALLVNKSTNSRIFKKKQEQTLLNDLRRGFDIDNKEFKENL